MTFLKNSPLGSKVYYNTKYDQSLLFPISRKHTREALQNYTSMHGYDIWHAYELSWLDQGGKPHVGLLRIVISSTSENIIESKSLKLYLNSFNNTNFDTVESVRLIILHDIASAIVGEVDIEIFDMASAHLAICEIPLGVCIDELDIEIDWEQTHQSNKNFLRHIDVKTQEVLHSNILRSNCLITNQPDFGTIVIDYTGYKLNQHSLLRYIASYRNHQEFHEQCVERIFCDIVEVCNPDSLMVYAHYTRRGGIDICPYRSSNTMAIPSYRRFIRQ